MWQSSKQIDKHISRYKRWASLRSAPTYLFSPTYEMFFLLAARDFTGSTLIGTIAGFEGIICGASAIYLAMATVINEQFGRTVMQIGDHKKAAAVQLKAAA